LVKPAGTPEKWVHMLESIVTITKRRMESFGRVQKRKGSEDMTLRVAMEMKIKRK